MHGNQQDDPMEEHQHGCGQAQCKNCMTSTIEPSTTGTARASSEPSARPPPGIDTTTWTTSTRCSSSSATATNTSSENTTATPALAPRTKKRTSSAKSKSSRKRTRTTPLSATSAAVSTGNGAGSCAWWTKSSNVASRRLWLPTPTDSVASASRFCSISATNAAHGSWFSVKVQAQFQTNPLQRQTESMSAASPPSSRTTSFRSSPSLQLEITDGVPLRIGRDDEPAAKRRFLNPPSLPRAELDSNNEPILRTRKIRLYPNCEERQKLRRWLGVARWTYNQCVARYNQELSKEKNERVPITKELLRQLCIKKSATLLNDPHHPRPWVSEVHNDTRDDAMLDFIKARDSNWAKKALNKNHHFRFKFRSRKDPQETFVVKSKYWNKIPMDKPGRSMYAFIKHMATCPADVRPNTQPPHASQTLRGRRYNRARRRCGISLPDEIEHSIRVLRTRLGHYYLVVSIDKERIVRHSAPEPPSYPNRSVVALDPGVRIFQTGYDPRGAVYKWGHHDFNRIRRLCRHHDRLQSKWSQEGVRHKQRYSMKRAGMRLRLRIQNLVNDLHKKMAKWLCDHYQVVLLPHFETSRLVKRSHRNIGSRTTRSMLTWAHYRFKQRLLFKAQEYHDCQVVLVGEEYTTITCGRCGYMNRDVGRAKTFECHHCQYSACRDGNAARNVLIKYLSEHA